MLHARCPWLMLDQGFDQGRSTRGYKDVLAIDHFVHAIHQQVVQPHPDTHEESADEALLLNTKRLGCVRMNHQAVERIFQE